MVAKQVAKDGAAVQTTTSLVLLSANAMGETV